MTNARTRFLQRGKRVKAKINKSGQYPRLSVFRSNKYISAQIIDDSAGKTLASSSGKISEALATGETLAKKAAKKKIKKVVFDRSGYKYHGGVKALAEGARKGGLEF